MIVTKAIVVRLDDELHKKVKIITVEKDTSIQSIVAEFLKSYVEQHQKSDEKE